MGSTSPKAWEFPNTWIIAAGAQFLISAQNYLNPLLPVVQPPDRLVPGILKVGKGLSPGGPSQTPFVSQTEALSTSEEAAGQVVQPQEPGVPPSGPAEPCRLAICFHSHLVKARVLWSVHHIAAPELLSGEGRRGKTDHLF